MLRINHRRASSLTLALLLLLPSAALAQKKHGGKGAPRSGGAAKVEAPKRVTVSIPDLLTGQKIVEAAMDFNTYKVPLASGGVVMVEFPARDSILRVHPGDQNLVTVDDTDTAPNYPLIFRPGSGFVVSKSGPQPFAHITVQMASGIPFVFQVYPVASVAESATHIVVRYDREKVVAARRASGLPVNYKPVPLRPGVYAPEEAIAQAPATTATTAPASLEETASLAAPASPSPTPLPAVASVSTPAPTPAATPSATPAVYKPAPASSLPAGLPSAPAPSRVDVARTVPVSTGLPSASRPAPDTSAAVGAPRPVAGGAGRVAAPPSQPSASPRPPSPATALNGSLRDYMKEVVSDSKAFSKFSKALYGLSVAVSRPKDVNLETRLIVIAVKNTLTESVRLVPGQPDLFIETLDDKKNPVLVEPIQKLGLETTAPLGDLLAPGATAYYAVAFTPPVLGTHQYLRISVAQTTAADAPASVDLTIKSR